MITIQSSFYRTRLIVYSLLTGLHELLIFPRTVSRRHSMFKCIRQPLRVHVVGQSDDRVEIFVKTERDALNLAPSRMASAFLWFYVDNAYDSRVISMLTDMIFVGGLAMGQYNRMTIIMTWRLESPKPEPIEYVCRRLCWIH